MFYPQQLPFLPITNFLRMSFRSISQFLPWLWTNVLCCSLKRYVLVTTVYCVYGQTMLFILTQPFCFTVSFLFLAFAFSQLPGFRISSSILTYFLPPTSSSKQLLSFTEPTLPMSLKSVPSSTSPITALYQAKTDTEKDSQRVVTSSTSQ